MLVSRTLLLTVGSVFFLASCSSSGTSLELPETTEQSTNVERGEITSIVTLPAVVVAKPSATLLAPSEGRNYRLLVEPGAIAKANSVVAEFSTSSGRRRVTTSHEVTVRKSLLTNGASVVKNMPLVEIELNQLALSAEVPTELLYRFQQVNQGGRAQVTDGPGPFDCPILSPPSSIGEQDKLTMVCVPDPPVTLFPNLAGLMAVQTGSKEGVLTLPISAVAGRAETGEVTRLVGASRTTVQVGLGVSDGVRIEITRGLSQGDTVSTVAPNLATTSGSR